MGELQGKRALVMGLGINGGGLGVARFLVQQGAEVVVTDLRDATVLAPALAELEGLPIRYVLGQHREEDFRTTDLVIRNPGVPRESRFLALARAHGARIEMEMTLFFRLCPGPIIGITGTRGKTTTTMLTGTIFAAQYPDTVIAGNLRISALEQLPRISPSTPVVLELSSWQLEGLGEAGLSPAYACVTNLSPDHLDRYGSMEEYGAAKQQIFLHQQHERGDVLVLNADDERVRSWAEAATQSARVGWFSTRRDRQELARLGDGAMASAAWWDGERLMWGDEQICTMEQVHIPGEHNRANIAAAVALARMWKPPLPADRIAHAIDSFKGVPDRLELLRELRGVQFINDTTATAPTGTIAALEALKMPVVLIAGGADKRLPFDGLAAAVAARKIPVRAVVLLAGSATERLAAAFADAGIQTESAYDRLDAAVEQAAALAQPGDAVLLSPGCASFGMFINEFDRGAKFRQIVASLE